MSSDTAIIGIDTTTIDKLAHTVYQTQLGILHQQNCFDTMKTMPDKSVNLILSDPPYNTTAASYDKTPFPLRDMWDEFLRIITDNGAIVLTASGSFVPRLMESCSLYYKYKWVWVRANAGNFVNAKNRPMTQHEDVLVFSKGNTANGCKNPMVYNPQNLIAISTLKKSGKNRFGSMHGKRPGHKSHTVAEFTNYPSDVLFFDNDGKKIHPNQKPVALFEYLIRSYTNPGDTVFDPCSGSATIGESAEASGRRWIACESDPTYFDIGVKRMQEYFGTRPKNAFDLI